jgi:hypothetical protein
MNFTIATVSNRTPTQWYYLQKEFYQSLNGHPVLTINYEHDDKWDGFTKKPKWLYRAIKEGIINTPYLIFTDSWDVVFATKPEEVIEKYLTFGTDIVINAERNCFPGTYKEEYDKLNIPGEYKYLNSGFIVGKTEAILACLESMDLPNVPGDYFDKERNCNIHPEDQTMWQKVFLNQPASIALDSQCEIAQTLHEADMDYFDFSEPRIKNKVTDSYPCVFHLNGSAKDKLHIRNPILEHLKLI